MRLIVGGGLQKISILRFLVSEHGQQIGFVRLVKNWMNLIGMALLTVFSRNCRLVLLHYL